MVTDFDCEYADPLFDGDGYGAGETGDSMGNANWLYITGVAYEDDLYANGSSYEYVQW